VARARAEAQLLALVADPTLHTAPIGMAGLSGFRGPEDEQKLIAFALERRPDLLLAKSGARASQRSADRFRRERIPTPSLIGAGYLVEQRYGFQVTGGVSFTLPTTDLNQGLIGRALSEKRGNELLKDALETRIRHEVSGAFRARMSAKAALELFRRERLPMAKELLDRAEFSYQAGLFSIAQLFDAYQSMWEARTQELTLERQRADSEVDVERAAALWPIRSDGQ
jgi:outer membrane protein TolC